MNVSVSVTAQWLSEKCNLLSNKHICCYSFANVSFIKTLKFKCNLQFSSIRIQIILCRYNKSCTYYYQLSCKILAFLKLNFGTNLCNSPVTYSQWRFSSKLPGMVQLVLMTLKTSFLFSFEHDGFNPDCRVLRLVYSDKDSVLRTLLQQRKLFF